ncbi:hypothetical protein Geob_0993 [Geotalea daltonii FRC-32]|uniref:Uncharacterized protein n=1 Tax=Geotalea daltonii (strain DSM 22248 / JCM 15807 / FRC-32) TaxID=316067 RepID=B9M2H6_GEODF|nr:hypothetical protein [Geotalea daltonii]ACM19355.1 hypothetical protein Geob_0993 [Geotalea daltonii FRC-32]
MKKMLFLLLAGLLISCASTSEEEVVISNKSEKVTENTLTIRPSKPIRTTKYPFNFLLIAVPSAYKQKSKGWALVAPNGDKIKVAAILKTKDGIKTRFDHVGFMYGNQKQYLLLSADPYEKLKEEYVEVEITASQAFVADEIKWLNTAKY